MKTKMILMLLFVVTMTSAQAPSGHIARYDFTGGFSNNQSASSGGTSNSPLRTAQSYSTTIKDRFGISGKAVLLNGIGVQRSDINSSDSNNSQSVSFWLKTGTNDGHKREIMNDNNSGSKGEGFSGIRIYYQNAKIYATFKDEAVTCSYKNHSKEINDNRWHHVAVVSYHSYIGGTHRLHSEITIDGDKQGGSTYVGQLTNTNYGRYNGNVAFFNGSQQHKIYRDGIDELIFYDRKLTDSEISDTAADIPLCTITIPDTNFKANLVANTSLNTDGDSEISCDEAERFTGDINCSGENISDLTGIEALPLITGLFCNNNNISNLDISYNTALTRLNCYDNNLQNLVVSNNTKLTFLKCGKNQLTDLVLSSNAKLTDLQCSKNQLKSLVITSNTKLTNLIFFENQIRNINVANNTKLTFLNCSENLLPSLDVTANGDLVKLYCQKNRLTSLNVANGNNRNMINMYAKTNPDLTCIQVDDVSYANSYFTDIDATVNFSLDCSAPSASIEDVNLLEDFKIYPNPVLDVLNIQLEDTLEKVEVYSAIGAKVLEATKNKVDVSNLSSGVYVLKVYTQNGEVGVKRFMKK